MKEYQEDSINIINNITNNYIESQKELLLTFRILILVTILKG